MRKFILVAATVATLAVPAVASADSTMVINPDSPAGDITATGGSVSDFDGSAMGFYNSRVTGNGSYISDQAHTLKAEGTPGRGAAVQVTLGHTK